MPGAKAWGEDTSTLHPDKEKHILAFDLIYCCSVYNLFDGISFTRPKTKERQLMQERKEKAESLFQKLKKARQDAKSLHEALEYINSVYVVGLNIKHKKFGEVTIVDKDDYSIRVDVPDIGMKILDIRDLVAYSLATINIDGYDAMATKYQQFLIDRNKIDDKRLERAEKEFAPYSQYL